MRIGLPHLFFGFVFCTSLGCEALRPAPEAGPDVAPGMSAPEAGSSSSGVVASPSAFEASRAWSDLEVLAAGPRRTGTEGAERARTYIREQFAALGLEVHEQALDIEKSTGRPPGALLPPAEEPAAEEPAAEEPEPTTQEQPAVPAEAPEAESDTDADAPAPVEDDS